MYPGWYYPAYTPPWLPCPLYRLLLSTGYRCSVTGCTGRTLWAQEVSLGLGNSLFAGGLGSGCLRSSGRITREDQTLLVKNGQRSDSARA